MVMRSPDGVDFPAVGEFLEVDPVAGRSESVERMETVVTAA